MSTKSHLWRWEVVARMAGARPAPGFTFAEGRAFTGLSIDSRTAKPGDLFAALRGDRFDGHDFIGDALARGVSGVLLAEDRWKGEAGLRNEAQRSDAMWLLVHDTLDAMQQWGRAVREEIDPETVAITGSTGKTTTKDLLAAALSAFGPVRAPRASHNNAVGVPLTLLGLDPDHRYLVSELGMNHPGEIGQLVRLVSPDVALITSVGRAHIGHFRAADAILRAKLEIAEGLSPDGSLVVPDVPEELAGRAREVWKGRVVTFGAKETSEVRRVNALDLRLDETRFSIAGLEKPLRVRALGRGAASCALGAMAACHALRLPLDKAAAAIAEVPPPSGRLEPVRLGGFTVLVDTYNASPESSLASLDFLLSVPGPKRRFVAFGEMAELGTFSRACHEEVGRLAARTAGAFFYGADAKWAHDEAVRLGGSSRFYASKEELARDLSRTLGDGDLVLIKGSRRTAMETVFERLRTGSGGPRRGKEE